MIIYYWIISIIKKSTLYTIYLNHYFKKLDKYLIENEGENYIGMTFHSDKWYRVEVKIRVKNSIDSKDTIHDTTHVYLFLLSFPKRVHSRIYVNLVEDEFEVIY